MRDFDSAPLTRGHPDAGRILEAFADRRYAAVVVTGAQGTGRTRLARAALDALSDEGAVTEWVAATASAAAIPFGALARFLPHAPPDAASDRLAQFLALRARFTERAGEGAAALVVDDAHLLDAASAALVQHLAEQRSAFVVATVLAGHDGGGPLLSLCKDGIAQRLPLRSLTEPEVAAMAEDLLGGWVDGPARRSLFEVTRGNPGLVRQVVEQNVRRGTLAHQEGMWSAVGPLRIERRAAACVEANLARLPEAERRALECLALAGPLAFDVLQSLVGAELVHGLERSGLITAHRRERRLEVRIDPLTAAALRADVPTGIAVSLRRELAQAITARGLRRRHDVLQVAAWRLETHDAGDPDLLLAAARTAADRRDHELAERLARAALAAGGAFAAAVQLGGALTCLRRHAEADAVLGAWRHELDRAPSADARAYVRWRTEALLWSASPGSDAKAVAFLRDAESARTDAPFGSMVRAMRAWVLMATGRDSEAVPAARSVVADAEAAAAAIRIAEHVVTLGSAFGGRPRTALRQGDSAAAGAGTADASWPRLVALVLGGRLDDAEASAALVYEHGLTERDGSALGRSTLVFGWTALMRGRVATSARWLTEAAARLRRSDVDDSLSLCLVLLAVSQAIRGSVDLAQRARDEAAAVAGSGRYAGSVVLADVRIAAATGRTTTAQRLALWAASRCDGRPLLQAALLHGALTLGCPASTVQPGLAAAAAATDAEWPRLLAEQAAAAARGDADGLQRAATGLERLGMLLTAAEVCLMAATFREDGGRGRQAMRVAAHGRRLLDRCEGALLPDPRGHGRAGAGSLTRREREVARLAASGLTSAAIARELMVSARTVETHLYNGYAKLGISRRADLPAALGSDRRSEEGGAGAGVPVPAPAL